VQLPLEFVRDEATGGFFKNPLMWLGFGLPTLIFTLNGLHGIYPAVPWFSLQHNLNQFFTERPFNALKIADGVGMKRRPLLVFFFVASILALVCSAIIHLWLPYRHNDAVLIQKAQEITEGSKDSWEATRRLSKWVAENISYAIPGGSTARKTYDIKAGECGAHSLLLAAFCRTVGIPARVVWGCMYAPNFGGCFGQHAWNEIYMGKGGWIPVDATAAETDYVDSGHIRIGAFESLTTALNAKEMEVLDYRVGSMKVGKAEEGPPEKYKAYVGNYTDTANNNVLKVFVQDGNLTVDIPGKIVLALNDPDEAGLWYSKITNQLYFIFKKNDSGEVAEMELHQIIPLPRKSSPEKLDENVPEKFRPYPGKYFLAALQAEFTVQYKDGSLAVDDPLAKQTIKLQLPDEKGRWVDEFDKNAIFFDLDDEGNVKSMNIDSVSRFRR